MEHSHSLHAASSQSFHYTVMLEAMSMSVSIFQKLISIVDELLDSSNAFTLYRMQNGIKRASEFESCNY